MKERRFYYEMLRKSATAQLGQCLKFINNSKKIVSSLKTDHHSQNKWDLFKLRPKAA